MLYLKKLNNNYMRPDFTRQITQEEHDKIIEFVDDHLEEMQSHDPEYENRSANQICSNFFYKNYGNVGIDPVTCRIKIRKKSKIPLSLQEFIENDLGISLDE